MSKAKKTTQKKATKTNGRLSTHKLARAAEGEVDLRDRFEFEALPAPNVETEEDLARYLREELPDWIEAVGTAISEKMGDGTRSLESSLVSDLMQASRFIAYALEHGKLPPTREAENMRHRIEAAARCVRKLGSLADSASKSAQMFTPPEGCL